MPPLPSLRTATDADADDVRALTRAAYAPWVGVIGREPLPMRADYAHAVRAHRIDLLHLDGELAALVEMVLKPDHLLIENIAVAPPQQGRGLGTLLLRHAEHVACTLGHRLVRLYTNRAFDRNVQLYLRRGYAIGREEAFMNGVTVHMVKVLPSRPG